MRAYCWSSGLIEIGRRLPDGALPIASGREQPLRAFIKVQARHGYKTRTVKGRPIKIPGSEILLVPGVPEAPNQIAAGDALHAWCSRIGQHTPVGVKMLIGAAA